MKFPLRILHLEDDPNDVELVKQILVAEGIACDLVLVETRSDFITSIEQGVFDLILADYSLPQFDGLSALVIAREKCPDVPFILVSGALGEELAIETLKKGATDYVLKNNLSRLLPAINRALHEVEERRERNHAEKTLKETQQSLEAVVETAPSLIVLTDPDGRIVLFNRACEELTGYKREEVIGKTITDLFLPAEWVPVVQKRFADPYAPEVRAPHENPWITKSGEEKLIEWRCTVQFDPKDGRPCILGTGIDITERKQAEGTLLRSEKKYRVLIENLPQKIFLKDRNSVYVSCNENYARDLKIGPEEITGKTDYDFYPKEVAEKYRADDQRIMGLGNIEEIEEKYFQNAHEIWVHTVKTPINDEKGNTIGILGIFWDITERKQAEEALRETRDYLEKLLNYANAPIVVWDPKFTITGFNHAFECLTGYKDKEVIGKNLHMLFPEASQEESLKKIVPTSSSEYWESVEIPILCKDGSIRLALWNSANIYAKDARTLMATIAQGQDITERKKAEEKIRRFNRLYSMLSEINEAIIRIRKRKDLFEKACRITVEKGLFRMTWIGLIDPDSHSLNSFVHGEYGEEYLDKIRISIKEAPERLGPIFTAIRTEKYVICNDLKDDSCIHPYRDEAIKCGYHSMAAFPLQIGTHIIGAINFYSGEPHFFDDEEISALTQLAGDISFALEHIEQQEQLQKRIEELEKFYEMAIGRELKIKGLKKEMEELKAELSQYKKESKYNSNEKA